MIEKKLHAIVLKAIPFKDRQSILTLLSEEEGITSMIVKGLSKKKPQLMACINPLSQVEFLYLQTRSNILLCKEASMIDAHLFLREKYSFLQMSIGLIQMVLDTQYPGKSSPSLYHLLSCYLKQIPSFASLLPTLEASFLLKLMKHEGVLLLQPLCSICKSSQELYLFDTDLFCRAHKKDPSTHFSSIEWRVMQALSSVRSFDLLKELTISEALLEKIKIYFRSQMPHQTNRKAKVSE